MKPATLNITGLFDIVRNDDMKRFEFNSKTNLSTSYTVHFDEVDSDLESAKIAIYFAVRKNTPELLQYEN